MANQRGKIIPEPQPNTRTILAPSQAPAIKGEGSDSILCGNCGITLVSNLDATTVIKNIVIKCPDCGSFNDIG